MDRGCLARVLASSKEAGETPAIPKLLCYPVGLLNELKSSSTAQLHARKAGIYFVPGCGDCRRRIIHRFGALDLYVSQGVKRTGIARSVNILTPGSYYSSCIDLRLPSHCATTKTPGRVNSDYCFIADPFVLRHRHDLFSRRCARSASGYYPGHALARGVRVQADLLLERPQRIDYETNMFVQIDAELFDSLSNVIAIYGSREGFVF